MKVGMPLQAILSAIEGWAAEAGVAPGGRDMSPFITAVTLVAIADGPASDQECEEISQVSKALTGQDISWEGFQKEVSWVEETGQEGAVRAVAEQITDANERKLAVRFAAIVAAGERGVNEKEGLILQKLGRALGFSHDQVLVLLSEAMRAAKG
jgi:tellurite resistance protein